jgi:two-component system, OmpR family, copper resistance phosphate regulon response regulator CusR
MKILVIEDEYKIAKSLKKGLENESFTVDLALDGIKGNNLAQQNSYDLIVLDLMLPGIDGLTILRNLRDKKIVVPTIILTARDATEDKVNGLNLGADDYLSKPFSFAELVARIRAQLRRSTTKENILTSDNLELDPYKHIVKRAGQEIILSNKEFCLLEYLLRNKGTILSADQIISHVWNYDYESNSNVVAVHMKNLRNKIDKAFPNTQPLLKTIRGLGYKLHG